MENAIWHGLLHKETTGNLLIAFKKTATGQLIVIVEDDGVGRNRAVELKSKQVLKKKSYGMQITQDRIALINRLNNIQASCRVLDLTDAAAAGWNEGGTRDPLEKSQSKKTKMIQALIIDDEKNAIEVLELQLSRFCKNVQVLATMKYRGY